MTETVLDSTLLQNRRLQAGLSRRRLATLLGVSQTTIRGLEQGTNHLELNVRLLTRLAGALGCTPRDLFAAPDGATPAQADDRTVEAAMLELRSRVHQDQLAAALGWTLTRTATGPRGAARAPGRHRQHTPHASRRNPRHHGSRRRSESRAAQPPLPAAPATARPSTLGLLREIARGSVETEKHLSHAQRVAMAQPRRARLVEEKGGLLRKSPGIEELLGRRGQASPNRSAH
jgi:transcriptional regulator with XRE-family HTH domain